MKLGTISVPKYICVCTLMKLVTGSVLSTNKINEKAELGGCCFYHAEEGIGDTRHSVQLPQNCWDVP